MNYPTPAQERDGELRSFVSRLQTLFAGELLAVIAQRPPWLDPGRHETFPVNLVVLVPEPGQPRLESVFRKYFVAQNPGFRIPVEIVGYQSFADKLALGDPTVVYLCASGDALFDVHDSFAGLREIAQSQHRVDSVALRRYLQAKCGGHFGNVGYLLARALNEVYMGAAAGLSARIIQNDEETTLEFLQRAAQWRGLRSLAQSDGIDPAILETIETMLSDIQHLLTATEEPEQTSPPLHFGQPLISAAQRLARETAAG